MANGSVNVPFFFCNNLQIKHITLSQLKGVCRKTNIFNVVLLLSSEKNTLVLFNVISVS